MTNHRVVTPSVFYYWRSLGLDARAANCLCSAGIKSVEAAQAIDDKTLNFEAYHIGPYTLRQIRQVAPYSPQEAAP
jgi:hypothetical protein